MDVSLPPAPKSSGKLPPQLLALVLARLEPAERLGSMARVCSAWRAAAVMATNSISACRLHPWRNGSYQKKDTALSGWLQAHAAAAALESLAVTGAEAHSTTLQLPVQQLATLRSLDLESLKLTVQGQADTQAAATALPPELSAITRLRLCHCPVGLSTLPAFTNLQHLVLVGSSKPPSSSPEVSGLLHLTHLQLAGGYAQDAVLGSVGALTSLQELLMAGWSYTAAGLAALPVSLTKLCVQIHARAVMMDPDSTPAVAALTALRWLEVGGAAGFSAALLRDMSSLQHLAVKETPLLAAAAPAGGEEQEEARGLGLGILSALTQLQHLELPQTRTELAAEPTTVDIAALTASSQLTCLIINQGLVKQEQYRHMFPEGRKLPKLRDLRASMGVVGTDHNVWALVRCCPNLERLDVGTVLGGEGQFERYDLDWCTVYNLRKLGCLTRLIINVQDEDCSDIVWRSMAQLTGLRDLLIRELHESEFGGILDLVNCRQLTRLRTHNSEERLLDFEMTASDPEAPDIWRELPSTALSAALTRHDEAAAFQWDVEGTLYSMNKAAAEHSLMLGDETHQLRKEVKELQATVAELESWRQQQVDLQGTVAVLQAQVQALLQQNSVQQG